MGQQQLQEDTHKLASYLEAIHNNFGYKMLVLEMSLYSEGKATQDRCVSNTEAIAQLTQLYMRAVEVLEDKYSLGFEYFNSKIQNLLKKRSVVEQLLKETKCSLKERERTMKAIEKAQIRDRREGYDMRLSFQNPLAGRQRVQEIIKNSELRLNMIDSKIQTGIYLQNSQLAERIRARKLKSQSSTKDANELLDSNFGRVENSQEMKNLETFEINVEQFEKVGMLSLRKSAKPNIFSSFSHDKV